MKNRSVLFLALALFLATGTEITSAAGNPALGQSKVYTLDTSSTNLPATYGATANQIASSLSGKSHLCVLNGSSTKLYGAFSATTKCTGATDMFVIPSGPNGAMCKDGVQTNTYFCLRSSSGTISSGVIDTEIR